MLKIRLERYFIFDFSSAPSCASDSGHPHQIMSRISPDPSAPAHDGLTFSQQMIEKYWQDNYWDAEPIPEEYFESQQYWLDSLPISADAKELLRQQSTTYEVAIDTFGNNDRDWMIALLRDQDRMWGAFDFGHYKGILHIDPGPINYDEALLFEWRAAAIDAPKKDLVGVEHHGEITFEASGEIKGYFFNMYGRHNKCEFEGNAVLAPPHVWRSAQSMVDEWNDLGCKHFMDDYKLQRPWGERERNAEALDKAFDVHILGLVTEDISNTSHQPPEEREDNKVQSEYLRPLEVD